MKEVFIENAIKDSVEKLKADLVEKVESDE